MIVDDITVPRIGGTCRRITFDNGYTASVICHAGSYGGDQGLFELAVMVDGNLVYDTPITGDVIGWLKEKQLPALLAQIEALPPRSGRS